MVKIEGILGSLELPLEELKELNEGDIARFDEKSGCIKVNGKKIKEFNSMNIIVFDENLGIRNIKKKYKKLKESKKRTFKYDDSINTKFLKKVSLKKLIKLLTDEANETIAILLLAMNKKLRNKLIDYFEIYERDRFILINDIMIETKEIDRVVLSIILRELKKQLSKSNKVRLQ